MDFFTRKVPNFNIALYMLSVRAPNPPYAAVDTYIFPLSPQRVRKRMTSMSRPYDTRGPSSSAGVHRSIDSWGITPFVYEIEGTTGWDLHNTDGNAFTGMDSIQRIQGMLLDYAAQNQIQAENNDSNTYTMEFSDFFNGEFYQVEPTGPQEIYASERAPLLQYYRFRLIGVAPVGAPSPEDLSDDPTSQMLVTPNAVVSRSTTGMSSDLAALY